MIAERCSTRESCEMNMSTEAVKRLNHLPRGAVPKHLAMRATHAASPFSSEYRLEDV